MVFGSEPEAIVRAGGDLIWQLIWKRLGAAVLLRVKVEKADLLCFVICGLSSPGSYRGEKF
jgi:hypothetical protein